MTDGQAETTASEPPVHNVGDALLATLRGQLALAVLLLVPAGLVPGGTWTWFRAWWLLAAVGLVAVSGNLALARFRPAHFAVRQQSVVAPEGRGQPRIDAIGSAALLGFGAAWLIFIPTDVFWLRLAPTPSGLVSAIGGVCAVIGAALTPLAVWENRFATPNVQDQSGDGQRVIDTGVYALIRHPIYAGNLLLSSGAALWLGSYAALAGLAPLLIATVGRILIEEAHLRDHVAGYEAYARRVRGRVIPFVL